MFLGFLDLKSSLTPAFAALVSFADPPPKQKEEIVEGGSGDETIAAHALPHLRTASDKGWDYIVALSQSQSSTAAIVTCSTSSATHTASNNSCGMRTGNEARL